MTDAREIAATYFEAWRADPVPVANWMHVEDGKIARIQVAFDARGIAGGS